MAILPRPGPKLAEQERTLLKRLARELLDTLKAERPPQQAAAWRRNAGSAIHSVLKNLLQKSSDDYRVKCNAARRHVYDSYCVREEACMRWRGEIG